MEDFTSTQSSESLIGNLVYVQHPFQLYGIARILSKISFSPSLASPRGASKKLVGKLHSKLEVLPKKYSSTHLQNKSGTKKWNSDCESLTNFYQKNSFYFIETKSTIQIVKV